MSFNYLRASVFCQKGDVFNPWYVYVCFFYTATYNILLSYVHMRFVFNQDLSTYIAYFYLVRCFLFFFWYIVAFVQAISLFLFLFVFLGCGRFIQSDLFSFKWLANLIGYSILQGGIWNSWTCFLRLFCCQQVWNLRFLAFLLLIILCYLSSGTALYM